MNIKIMKLPALCIGIAAVLAACTPPRLTHLNENRTVPNSYYGSTDSTNSARVKWRDFFKDPNLVVLIDSALHNNQELNIVMQEINIARNEIRARKGAYLPFLGLHAAAATEKPGRFTRNGAVEDNLKIADDTRFPEPLPDFLVAASATWEIDIWKKLRNARASAAKRYLASVEGRNFMITRLVAEIANSYYELMALDNQLTILRQNIAIQQNALEIVKLEKASARVTELAVKKFEAEVLKNQSRQYDISQQIIETENRINFLVGRFPQRINRSSVGFTETKPDTVFPGVPVQLLSNRPDIRQAENNLTASKLDVRVVKANFYPSLVINGAVGTNAFNVAHLMKLPESLLYMLAADLMAPVINRNAIKAEYYSASSRQVQAVYNYERAILRATLEVSNQVSNISNLAQSFALRSQQVQRLMESIDVSTTLFKSARADYMEVLMTQRDALESRFDLVDTKKQQMNAMVNLYQALGGGWY